MKKVILLCFLACSVWQVNAQSLEMQKSDAIMHETARNYTDAVVLYESAAAGYEKISVYDTLCIYRAGVCRLKLKEYSKAMPFFIKLDSLKMGSAELYLSMGDGYVGLKDFTNASTSYVKATGYDVDSKTTALRKLSLSTLNGGQYDETLKYSDEYLVLVPGDVNVIYNKVMAYEQLGKFNEAIELCDSIIAIDPENKKGIERLGILHCKKTDKEYDKEKRRYESMKNPTRVDFAYAKRNLDNISKGYLKAIPYLEKAIANNPDNAGLKSMLENAKKRLE